MAEATGAPLALGSVLDALLDSKGSWQAGLAGGELGKRWADVVGERLAGDTAPGGMDEQGTLIVCASSAAWAAQLRFLSGRIAENANGALGRDLVRAVRVVVDPGLAEGPPTEPNGDQPTGGSAL
jgi:predicted nucleic acid-binding Zn ribbon protein